MNAASGIIPTLFLVIVVASIQTHGFLDLLDEEVTDSLSGPGPRPLQSDTSKSVHELLYDAMQTNKGCQKKIEELQVENNKKILEKAAVERNMTMEILAHEKEKAALEKNMTIIKTQLDAIKTEMNRRTEDTELIEFLLFTREGISQFEKYHSKGCPENSDNFSKVLKSRSKSAAVRAEDITDLEERKLGGNSHFRAWMWILLYGSEESSEAIPKLRKSLDMKLSKYVWFANQMAELFNVLCGDVHGKSPLEVRYMKKYKFEIYANFFTEGCREAVLKFLRYVYVY
nr:PREDICTED: uncharacterized protein LOC109041727 [Bemisia tabaci]